MLKVQLRYGEHYKWGARWETTIKKSVSDNCRSLGQLTRPASWAHHRETVGSFLWECVRKTGSWCQAKETDGSALIDRDINLTVEKQWQSQITPKPTIQLTMLPNSFDVYSVQERSWRRVCQSWIPLLSPYGVRPKKFQGPDYGNAKGHSRKCMFEKCFINRFSKRHRKKLRRTEGNLKVVDLGEQTKKVFCDPERVKETKCCQILHGFFTCVKKFFAPFDLVDSIHVIPKLQNSSL